MKVQWKILNATLSMILKQRTIGADDPYVL